MSIFTNIFGIVMASSLIIIVVGLFTSGDYMNKIIRLALVTYMLSGICLFISIIPNIISALFR